jgi:hypothetical protein
MAEQWKIDTASFLRGARLCRKRWTQRSKNWDHDHCAACWARFAAGDGPDVLREGYATCDDVHGVDLHRVCEACFDEFKNELGWTDV